MKKVSGRSAIYLLSAFVLMIGLMLSGCNSSSGEVKKQKYDFTEGKVLGTLGTKDEDVKLGSSTAKLTSAAKQAESEATITENKTVEQSEANRLSEDVKKMITLCDSLNRTSSQLGTKYNTSPEYVWTAIHNYVMGADVEQEGFRIEGDVVVVDPDTVKRYVYAMFGELKDIPEIPYEFQQKAGDEYSAPVTMGNDLKYRFAMGDRGDSRAEVESVISYTDGTKEVKVALIGEEDDKEDVCFIYSLRDNGKDTSATSQFAFEITGQRYADMLTDMKMKGIPYIDMVLQKYPSEEVSSGDSALNPTIEEVPYFCCNKEKNEAVEELNARISYEIMEFAMAKEDKQEWHEICSYPVTNSKYVQVVVTYSRWPNYGTEGNLTSYNYDVANSVAMGLEEALKLCNMTFEEVFSGIEKAYVPENEGDVYDRAEYDGFFVLQNGSIDFYATIYVNNPNAEPFNRIIAYNTEKKELRYIFESETGVVSEKMVDTYIPNLTHGKQDVTEK